MSIMVMSSLLIQLPFPRWRRRRLWMLWSGEIKPASELHDDRSPGKWFLLLPIWSNMHGVQAIDSWPEATLFVRWVSCFSWLACDSNRIHRAPRTCEHIDFRHWCQLRVRIWWDTGPQAACLQRRYVNIQLIMTECAWPLGDSQISLIHNYLKADKL